MDINQIISDLCGVDDQDDPKSIISINYSYVSVENPKDIQEQDTLGTEEAIVQIYPISDEMLQIDLIFQSSDSLALYDIWNLLEKYTAEAAEFTANGGERCPALGFYFIPFDDTEVPYYLYAALPFVHFLTALHVNQRPNCIRMMFHTTNIFWLELDQAFDFSQIDEEIIAEFQRRDEINLMAEEDNEKKQAEAERISELSKKYLR